MSITARPNPAPTTEARPCSQGSAREKKKNRMRRTGRVRSESTKQSFGARLLSLVAPTDGARARLLLRTPLRGCVGNGAAHGGRGGAFALWACPPSRVSWEGVLLLSTGSCLTAFEYTWVRNPRPPPKSAALVALAAIPSASLVSHFGAGPPSCTRRSLVSSDPPRPCRRVSSQTEILKNSPVCLNQAPRPAPRSVLRAATEERLCS